MFSGLARCFGMTWLSLALFAAPALAEGRRVALVIGNNAYMAEAALENAVRDADLVAAAFRRVGFEVTTYHNLDSRALRTALQRFEQAAEGADVAAIYFAGHGVAVDGRNWLLPVDAKLDDVRHLDDEAVPDTRLTAAVDGARGLQLVILDACRNNPFTPRMAGRAAGRQVRGRGLDPIGEQDLPPNRLIAFSARDGQVAQDGPSGGDGPYAVALAQRLVQPGVDIGILFRRVRDDVAGQTRAAQVPWTYSNLGGQELYLAGAASVVPPPPPVGGYPVPKNPNPVSNQSPGTFAQPVQRPQAGPSPVSTPLPAKPDIRSRFRADSIKMTAPSAMYSYSQGWSTTIVIENQSSIPVSIAAVDASLQGCQLAGFHVIPLTHSNDTDWVKRNILSNFVYIPPGGQLTDSVIFYAVNCPLQGMNSGVISIRLMINVENDVFAYSVSAQTPLMR